MAQYSEAAFALQRKLLLNEETHGAALEVGEQELAAKRSSDVSGTCESAMRWSVQLRMQSAMADGTADLNEVEVLKGELKTHKEMLNELKSEALSDSELHRRTAADLKEQLRLVEKQARESVADAQAEKANKQVALGTAEFIEVEILKGHRDELEQVSLDMQKLQHECACLEEEKGVLHLKVGRQEAECTRYKEEAVTSLAFRQFLWGDFLA